MCSLDAIAVLVMHMAMRFVVPAWEHTTAAFAAKKEGGTDFINKRISREVISERQSFHCSPVHGTFCTYITDHCPGLGADIKNRGDIECRGPAKPVISI